TDQRGFPRVAGAAVDIGAVEAQAIPGFDPAVVTSLTDTFDGLPNGVSLREAVAFSPPGATLTFAPGLDGQTITLGGSQILLDKSVTIDASALPGGISISGNANANGTLDDGESRIFEVATGKVVVLRALRLIKGQASTTAGNNSALGGAILTEGSLNLDRCFVSECRALFGGGIGCVGGSLTITQSTLSGNSASDSGGGIVVLGGSVEITQSTLSGNSAFSGGGIHLSSGSVEITQSTLSGNSASDSGGGIRSSGGSFLTLTRSIVAGNLTGGDIDGSFTDNGNNLLSGDPLLAALGDYGGPTPTMPPLPGSPAIDAGGAAASAFPTDQRGFPRVAGAAVDIGAVEFDLDIDSGLPGTLAFGSALTTVLEEAGAGMVPVVRTGGITGSVSVTVNSAPGTATAADFDAVSGLVLTFAQGERQKLVPVTVLADTLKEPTELFTLTLSAPTGGAALGTPNPGIVRIIDSALDKAKPALSLLTPKNNEIILEAAGNVVALTGSAKDNIGIERVEISLDGGDFQPAALTHAADFKSCTFALPLTVTPGLRTVLVRAVDTRGLLSAPVKRAFTFRVVRQLAVNVSGPPGSGTVTKGFEPNSQRFVGIPHTITAAPKPGFVFTGWTANDFTGTGVTTAARELPKLAFLMREGLVLTANFLANPFTPQITGIHSGLALPDAGTTPGAGTVGLFTATVTGTGAFTGSLMLDGAKLPVSGLFTHQGQSRFGKTRSPALVLLRKGKPALTITLALDMSGATGRITGTVTQEGGATSDITADRAHYSSKSPADPALAGAKGQRYNLILPAKAQTPARALNLYPQGTGIGGMTVKPDGKTSFTLLLADGTKLTAAAALSKNDDCPLFAQLYGKLGLLAAQVTLAPAQPATDATGPDSVWFRPAQPKATSYRLGWPQGVSVDLFGSQFHIPPAAPPASVFPGLGAVDLINGNAALTFTGGLLVISPSTLGLNIDPANKVTNAPAADKTFTAALTKTTGEWKGVFTHSDGKKPAWQAATFQKAGAHQGGHGFFLSLPAKPADGLAESGAVRIQAR
ncbi:MAG TPA: choice-of-anchor Q domain-containing protein, partial [Prosthecobacter sp.]|nr:choice-of-anchor Q domain-containing protein [Prosthecobacter sp.]